MLACYAAAKEAHERARRGEGPTLIEAHVVRLTSHSSDDDQRRYRDPAEVEALKERDPIPMFAAELRAAGVLTDEVDERHAGRGQGRGQRGVASGPRPGPSRPPTTPTSASTPTRSPAAARRPRSTPIDGEGH